MTFWLDTDQANKLRGRALVEDSLADFHDQLAAQRPPPPAPSLIDSGIAEFRRRMATPQDLVESGLSAFRDAMKQASGFGAVEQAAQAGGAALGTVQDVMKVGGAQVAAGAADLAQSMSPGRDVREVTPNPARQQQLGEMEQGRQAHLDARTRLYGMLGMDPEQAARAAEESAARKFGAAQADLEAVRETPSFTAGAPRQEETILQSRDWERSLKAAEAYQQANPVGETISELVSPASFPIEVLQGAGKAAGVAGMAAGLVRGGDLFDAAGQLIRKASKVEEALDKIVIPGREKPGLRQILGPRGEPISTSGPEGAVVRSGAAAGQAPIDPETAARLPNLTKAGIPPDVRATMIETARNQPDLIDRYRRGKITHRELIDDLAPRLGLTAEDFLKTQPGKAFNEAELLALRSTVVEKTRALGDMAESIAARGGVRALNDLERAEALRTLIDAARLQAIGRGAAATAGRTLNQQKIKIDAIMSKSVVAGNEMRSAEKALADATTTRERLAAQLAGASPADQARLQQQMAAAEKAEQTARFRLEKAQEVDATATKRHMERATQVLDALGGRKITEKMLEQFIELQQSGDTLATAKFLRGMQQPTWWERTGVIRYASMLSATSTHLANATSNLILAGLDVGLKPLAVGIDAARAGITGGKRTRYMAEIRPQTQAIAEGAVTGWKNAVAVIRTGIDPLDTGKLERFRPGLAIHPTVDAIAEMPLRFMVAGDVLFRSAAAAGHFRALATRRAIQEGYKGSQVAARVAEIMRDAEEFPSLIDAAQKSAARVVLQERRPVSEYLMGARNVPGLGPIVDVAMPFIRTPYNVAAQGVGMTPAGLLGVVNDARRGKAGDAADTAARAIFGTAVMGVATSLAANGFITGPYPEDAADRSILPRGWQPWSFRIPHEDGSATYLAFNNLGPVGVPLAIAALLGADMAKGKAAPTTAYLGRLAAGVGRYATDQTFVRGLSDVVKALEESGRYAESLAEGIATQFMPYGGLQRQITRALGMGNRDPNGAIEALLATTPFTAGMVPERRDILGQPAPGGPGPLATFLSPVRVGQEQPDPMMQEYQRLAAQGHRVGITRLGDSIAGLQLTTEQQQRYRQLFGEELRKAMDRTLNRSYYQRLSGDEQAAELQAVERKAQESAADRMIDELGPAWERNARKKGQSR